VRFPLVALAFLATGQGDWAAAAEASPSPPVLDWAAPRVSVHVDTVPVDKVEVFEGARRRWLARVREGGAYRPDGRPLFFSGRRDGLETYVTLYPFSTWTDLDARAAATRSTEAAVGGKAAVEDYDSGDAALVAPHRSEIWLRQVGLDYAPSVPLRAVEARTARLEVREMPVGAATARLDAAWPGVIRLLTDARYPLTARAYWSLFGSGQLVLLWLGGDATGAAAPLPAAVKGRLDAVAPLREVLHLARRDDLSNLPPK
jgi:hypothetical protein